MGDVALMGIVHVLRITSDLPDLSTRNSFAIKLVSKETPVVGLSFSLRF